MPDFHHPALDTRSEKPLVYTAMSKHNFCYRQYISAFALKQGVVPLNPFMNWDYFLSDLVERDLIREGNNRLVQRSDELWVFGGVSNGVLAEIQLAKLLTKPIRFFQIESATVYVPIEAREVHLEEDISMFRHLLLSLPTASSEV